MREDSAGSWEVTLRVARYAYDRLTNPIYGVGAGAATCWCLAAVEGSLHLQPPSSSWDLIVPKTHYVLRYATHNVIPSLIWETQPPAALVESSRYLRSRLSASDVFFSKASLPASRAMKIRTLCSLRGAVAGTVLLSNVIGLTTLWQQARQDFANRILQGREPPLRSTSSSHTHRPQQNDGTTIRLAGVRSNVTQLPLQQGRALWPIYEQADKVLHVVTEYGCPDQQNGSASLPSQPVYWQVDDGAYSKASSWKGMKIPWNWLYTVNDGTKLLYLEADATEGDEQALAMRQHDKTFAQGQHQRLGLWKSWSSQKETNDTEESEKLDLDLREVAQGFRRLSQLVGNDDEQPFKVVRVLLVDPTVIVESGGGRRMTVREQVTELKLTDILVDARESLLCAVLEWLSQCSGTNQAYNSMRNKNQLRPVILETPSKAWFHSIQTELRKHGYEVMDRSQLDDNATDLPPMLVYERSGADTVHTIHEYIEQSIVKDPSQVCALLTSYEEVGDVAALNDSLQKGLAVGCICSSVLHDSALEWVRQKCLQGVPASQIQKELDEGKAWRGVQQE